MATITFCVGPAAAGKSKWAHDEVATRGAHNVQRVNLDDYLTMVHGRSFGDMTAADVKLAMRILTNIIRAIADSGRDVIVDNTHLSTRFPNHVRDELGDVHTYRIRDFTSVPVETLIARDQQRAERNPGAYVGHDVIMDMHKKAQSLRAKYGGAGLPLWVEELNRSDGIELYEPDASLPKAVIVDIDGTLAIARTRGPYDTSRYLEDELRTHLGQLVNDLAGVIDPYQILILTGRDEEHHETLLEWLEREKVLWDEIHMRPRGDSRRDNVVKLDLFNEHVRHRFNVIAAFDDRDRVVRLWRRLGLLTLQVNYGDF